MPPLHTAPTHLAWILPSNSQQGSRCRGSAMPMCPRTPTATPALVEPAAVRFAGSTLKDQPSRAARRSADITPVAGTRSSCNKTMSAAELRKYLMQVFSEFPLIVSMAHRPSRLKLPSAVRAGVRWRSGPTTLRLPHCRCALWRCLGTVLGCLCPCTVARSSSDVPAQTCAAARRARCACLQRVLPRAASPIRRGATSWFARVGGARTLTPGRTLGQLLRGLRGTRLQATKRHLTGGHACCTVSCTDWATC
jgi:hypothetical protein